MGTAFVRRNKTELNPYDFYPTPYESTLAFLHAEFDGQTLPNWLEPACGLRVWGDGSIVSPYRCGCGVWEFEAGGWYKLNPKVP